MALHEATTAHTRRGRDGMPVQAGGPDGKSHLKCFDPIENTVGLLGHLPAATAAITIDKAPHKSRIPYCVKAKPDHKEVRSRV